MEEIKGVSVDSMSNDFVIREAGVEDCIDVFKWRNHSVIRKHFFNTNPIPWDEHKRWFDIKSNDPNTKIYIACCGEEKVGTVRFDDVDNSVKVSVMLNPDYIGKGFGAEIIRIGTDRFIKEKSPAKPIIAEIKKENIQSIKAFQKAGFKESYVTYVFPY